jgi:hypothetical protein
MITLAINLAALIFVGIVALVLKALIPAVCVSLSDLFTKERN